MAEDDWMTPEEIEELRTLADRLNATEFENNLSIVFRVALEHIDQQAASLDETEALIKKNAERMNGYMTRIAELESQIIQQTGISASRMEERERMQKQIAALQEIAEAERASILACSEYEPPVTVAQLRVMARRQLSEEHPEAFR